MKTQELMALVAKNMDAIPGFTADVSIENGEAVSITADDGTEFCLVTAPATRELVEAVLQRWEREQHPYQTDEVRGLIAEVRDALACRSHEAPAFLDAHRTSDGPVEDEPERSREQLRALRPCRRCTYNPCMCSTPDEPATGGAG